MKHKKKSLRVLVKEIGVSASYLSQIQHGKTPISDKVLSKVLSISKQGFIDTPTINRYNTPMNAELCSGSTGDFGSLSPGSNPGSAARFYLRWGHSSKGLGDLLLTMDK